MPRPPGGTGGGQAGSPGPLRSVSADCAGRRAGRSRVTFCDLPTVPEGPVGRFLVSQMAAVAELEAGLIGQRTKAALASARARGVAVGGYRGSPAPNNADRAKTALVHSQKASDWATDLAPVISQVRQEGAGSLGGASRSAE